MRDVITDAEARANLAQNIKTILDARGLTQTDLASACHRPKMSISNICRGTRLASVTLAAGIAEALGYSTDDLIGPTAVIEARERLRVGRKKSLVPA
jgi:transcriptional regulator with XRE-family HTH domain